MCLELKGCSGVVMWHRIPDRVHLQVSLHETIGSTVEMVAAEASRKGLEIAYTMDDQLLRRTLLGDAIRIRQVGSAQCIWLSFHLFHLFAGFR